uniref:Lrr receptor protein kinase n=1 Tax=Rhizophora mucronata TaxID=61149 RepID=A0A2P2Q2Y5_RHIMU
MEEEARGGVVVRLALILFLIRCMLSQQVPLNSPRERYALLHLRSSLGLRTNDWPIKSDPCTNWRGIHCNNGRVSRINVSGFRRTRIGRLNPGFRVDALANLTFLESFNASRFRLPGSIPPWFGFRLGSLQELDLRSCSVTGLIPASLGNLTRLSALYLSGNGLAGSIPAALGQLKHLAVLDLSMNLLAGSIPAGFALLGNLSRLDLSSNYLSGSIPSGIGNITGLHFLNLSDNSLTGSIPVGFGNLSNLVELNLSKNSLSGSLPVELKGLTSLQKMDIGGNELQGRLPDGLFSTLDKLQFLVLSGNKLDDALPRPLSSLPNLQLLDVSDNDFTGLLPSFSSNGCRRSGAIFNVSNNMLYGTLPSLFGNFCLIDLSGNYLQGAGPNGSTVNFRPDRNCLQGVSNQRSLEDCRLFYAKRGIGFNDFRAPESIQPPLPEPASNRSRSWIYILVGLVGGVCFIAVLVLVMIVCLRKCDRGIAKERGSANVGPVPEGGSPSLPKDAATLSNLGESFTYEHLLHATGEFSEANLIKHGHSGDLFFGSLEGGFPIVVKKINLTSLKKESYMMELDLFSKYPHTKLVPLLGHCLENENEKFLVYKHMPNGDLANSFYRVANCEEDGFQSLDWITRLKIAIGAAEGLSYLHHECSPPLVHRDVQVSSILLDDKFEVRLGSLSEVHPQEGDLHHNTLTRFFWKQQSLEPGPSGPSPVTCAYDVFCFGKVLLELVTGKLGISKSDDATSREWLEHTLGCISKYDKELVTKIIDPSLIVDEDLLEEVWAMALVAMSCLNPKPSKRPPMKYVLKALENPLKVVREESYSSGRLRTTSSRRSWSSHFLGSWRHSSSDHPAVPGQTIREGISDLKQSGRISHGSGQIEQSSSNKRLSSEIFPEPLEMEDMKRRDEH